MCGGSSSTRRQGRSISGNSWNLTAFHHREVWPAQILDWNPNYRGKTLFDVLFRNGKVDKFPANEVPAEYENREAKAFGFYVKRACSRNTPSSVAVTATISLTSTPFMKSAGCDGRSSTARRRSGAIAKASIPTSRPGKGVDFYGNKDGKGTDHRRALRAAGQSPARSSTSGWSPAGRSNIGTPAP